MESLSTAARLPKTCGRAGPRARGRGCDRCAAKWDPPCCPRPAPRRERHAPRPLTAAKVRSQNAPRRVRLPSATFPPLSCPLFQEARARSEEHTSELQSLAYLVCRLLLEKKKKNHY